MTTTEHATWSLERTYPTSPAQVFAAWASADVKRRWFVGPNGEPNESLSVDFRVGGLETAGGSAPDGDSYSYEAVFRNIVDGERIVTTYEMAMNGRLISVSVATVELVPEGDSTRLTYTEQGAYLDGLDTPQQRQGGVGTHLDHLGRVLADDDAPGQDRS